ncbi:hypothetical protein PV327_007799 [Microctonus hyperodae]|nr:hypothetical protein PV327_007799 [Microctonus hyperodae]
MCSAILCEINRSKDPTGSSMSSQNTESSSDNLIQNATQTEEKEEVEKNEPIECESQTKVEKDVNHVESISPSPRYVTRQDSGVPEDLASPCTKQSPSKNNDDLDDTINSDGNVTVIHVSDTVELTENKDNKDGSDSGVEGCTAEILRASGYASSCNGLDEVSCDSSLVSCCSVYEDTCAALPDDLGIISSRGNNDEVGASSRTPPRGNGEATSEGGSESSSVAGSISARGVWTTPKRPLTAVGTSSMCKKKMNKAETPIRSSRSRPTQIGDASQRLPSSTRSKIRAPTPRAIPSKPQLTPRDRAKSREKSIVRENGENSKDTNAKIRSSPGATRITRIRSRPIPDSLTLSGTSALAKEIDKDLAQRGASRGNSTSSNLPRCPSTTSRGRSTAGSTPSEECRKPLSTPRSLKAVTRSVNQELKKSCDTKNIDNKTLDTYATLPRRNKAKMAIALDESKKSVSREASLNRGRKRSNSRDSVLIHKSLPLHNTKIKHTEKILIYHEISVQTGLTGRDIDDAMAGIATNIYGPEVVDRIENECQTECHMVPIDELKNAMDEAKKFAADAEALRQEKEKLEAKLSLTERQLTAERNDHTFTRQELERNASRILAILGTPASEQSENNDSLLELESHFQESGQVVANQQIEIADLHSLCRMLNRDLEKSFAAQKALLQHQQEVEAQTMELQEFLQLEKTAMSEAMKDVEAELKTKTELLAARDVELERKTEECKHLVRISEQRRQENLSLEMKLNAVERRSKELLLTQGAAVSGAAVALSGLGSRLEGFVEQLEKSYKISEKDLEDVVYHNEAYSRSNSSVETSPISSKQHSLNDLTPSPKRNSFVSAVIGAIRDAATHPFVRPANKKSADSSKQQIFKELSMESSAELLDFETEPCLMMESVLEDVALPDTYSRNMVSSSDSLRRALSVPEPITETTMSSCQINDECTSLTNLTQAILNRRRAEEHEDDDEDDDDGGSISDSEATGHTDVAVPTVDYCTAVNLVDQVIEVDNLVTKLLKVLRIIQLENDTCIRELRDEKVELEGKLANGIDELNGLKTNSQDESKIQRKDDGIKQFMNSVDNHKSSNNESEEVICS